MLCHPSSVDSLTTSAGQEDHVSMGGFSARKVLKVVENVEKGTFVIVSCLASYVCYAQLYYIDVD